MHLRKPSPSKAFEAIPIQVALSTRISTEEEGYHQTNGGVEESANDEAGEQEMVVM